MDEQLKTLLIESVKDGKTAVWQSVEFLKAQAPELVSQYLRWSVVSNVFWLVISLIVIIGVSLIYMHLYRLEQADSYKDYIEFKLILGFAGLVFTIVLFCCINDLLHVLTAPKHYLYSEFIEPIFKKESK